MPLYRSQKIRHKKIRQVKRKEFCPAHEFMNESCLLDDGKDLDDIENKREQGVVSRVNKFEAVRETLPLLRVYTPYVVYLWSRWSFPSEIVYS